jgi:hypothetical protein
MTDNAFDSAPMFAEQLEKLEAPTGMETSVGLYQAVDVASDDAKTADTAQPVDAKTESQSPIKESLPALRKQATSQKAAALVGATTLTGALVWLNKKSSQASQSDAIAQKRRVPRSKSSR